MKKDETKHSFYIFPLFLRSATIQWVRKFSLNTTEMVESPSEGVKNALFVSGVYMCPYSVLKALTTCSVSHFWEFV